MAKKKYTYKDTLLRKPIGGLQKASGRVNRTIDATDALMDKLRKRGAPLPNIKK